MKKVSKINQTQLREQIFQLRLKIFDSQINKVFSLENMQKGTHNNITLSQINVQEIKIYIRDLHTLILKLSQYSQSHNQREKEILHDVKTAMKLAEIMRQNLMWPLSAQEFTENQALQYRVLLNIYMQNQTRMATKSPQKESYYRSISQIEMYNSKLQEKIKQLQQKKQELETIQSLRETNTFLQSENEYLKKQNQLASARVANYLSVKSLTQSQQVYINKQKQELQQKKQEINLLIEENKQLKERVNGYGQSDRKASQQMKLIKENFMEYFTKKKKNCQSNLH